MVERVIDNFNLEQICRSGQCFRMDSRGAGRYSLIAGGRYLETEQQNGRTVFFCEQAEFEDFWEEYFDLRADYAFYMGKIGAEDCYLSEAAQYGSGIRILRQDLWEMIVSFLISQQNNILRIRRCIENICDSYGEKQISSQGEEYCAFPTPQALAVLKEDALMACNLGYRSKYVVRAARNIVDGHCDLENIRRLPYLEAREELLKLYGVGGKVADCICLFALHHLEAFPVDTHIRQAMEKHYRQGFPMEQYQGCQGVLQQYMFYYEPAGGKQIP